MSRILLADDSAHAQRMGVRILREEGFEVVSVTDGEAAVVRLAEVNPDLILADVFLPGKSGVELCRLVKENPRHRRARVVLTAGILETFDEDAAKQAGCDAILRKPFEASVVVSTVRELIEQSASEPPQEEQQAEALLDPDPERVKAAVTLALDAAFPRLVDEIAERVLAALRR
jgi:CheY-like chemotaxis protein